MIDKRKKAQAAMEFLMTYGWAILAAIIAIGVLAYFYFSPGDLGSGIAAVGTPFVLDAHNVKTDGVNLGLRNGGQESLTITGVTVTIGSTICEPVAAPGLLASGATVDVAAACVLTVGDNIKGDIVVTYTKAGSAIELTSTGTVSNKVIAA